MPKDIKVSVIVPIYMVEDYLRRCLNSLIMQTLKEIEIILVDDCGGDNSYEIAAEYARSDSRIILIQNEENRGQGFSRNVGIKMAKGEYIAFVDSDDWIDFHMYENLYKKAKKNDLDIIKCDFNFINYRKPWAFDFSRIHIDFNKVQAVTDNPLSILGLQPTAVWNGLYKRQFLMDNSLFFDEIMKVEDILFSWETMLRAKRIMFVDDVLYNYNRLNVGSEVTTGKYIEYFAVNIERIKTFIEPGGKFNDAFILYCYNRLCRVLDYKTSHQKHELFNQYHNFIKDYDKSNVDEIINKGIVSLKMKFFVQNDAKNYFNDNILKKIKRTMAYCG